MTWGDLVYAAVKGPFSNMWPMLLLPLCAAILCEVAARRLPPTRADWRVAAALAAAPGLLFLTLAVLMLWRIFTHDHIDPAWQHVVKYQLTAVVAGLFLARAVFRSWRRHAAIAQLVKLSAEPPAHLAQAARRAGVRVRSLPCLESECFVAGAVMPTVYISAGAVARLSEVELEAALRHESAHIRGRDTAVLSLLGWLRDLVPAGSSALNAYQQARERAADEAAVRVSGPVALASALLAMACAPERPLPAIGISGTASPVWRLHAILGTEDTNRTSGRPVIALASLAITFAFAGWPTLQYAIIDNFCACVASNCFCRL